MQTVTDSLKAIVHDALWAGFAVERDHLEPELIAAYATDSLPLDDEERVVRHLDVCATCSAEVDAVIRTRRSWRGADGEKRLDGLLSRILCGIEDHGQKTLPRALVAGVPDGALMVHGAIQRECDYVLPSGLHADTHIDPFMVGASETLLEIATEGLASTLRSFDFDTVVSAGWVMGTIARRLLLRVNAPRTVRHVRVHAYDESILLDSIRPGSHSLLLLDVVASGAQMSRLSSQLELCGRVDVRALAIVNPFKRKLPDRFQAIWAVPVELSPETLSQCIGLPRREYNPVACRLTQKKHTALNVSRFLRENRHAEEFWNLVDLAQAFEHHHVEGKRHYSAYVDTYRLLTCPLTGPTLISNFVASLRSSVILPEVLLVRNRQASVMLARAAIATLEADVGLKLDLVVAKNDAGRLVISTAEADALRDRSVLVIDTAAAHGDTIDDLTLIGRKNGATQIGAAVVLSRLGEAREAALAKRLSGGFVYLYSVPVPPCEVHQNGQACWVCAERAALKRASKNPSLSSIKLWVEPKTGRRRPPVPIQEFLPIDERPLLERCKRGIAAGATLHALHATMGNGMAPLSLPEIIESKMPLVNRMAMLQALPAAVLRTWGDESLTADLRKGLSTVDDQKLWLAIADYLARAGSSSWIDEIEPMLDRDHRHLVDDGEVWHRLSLALFRFVATQPANLLPVKEHLQRIRVSRERASERAGIGSMLKIIDYRPCLVSD
jgi:hypothetical protein